MRYIQIYDTTLRDGAQGPGISFSLEDKLKIAEKLDELGVDYIEGGWPGSNPKDDEFFRAVKDLPLTRSKIAAFGMTRRARFNVEDDPQVKALIDAGTPVVTIFGKSWLLHVREVLRITPDKNLELIRDTISYLKENVPEVIFDAEHFFDGYKNDPSYAMETILAAQEAGADLIVLCDTNGGALPSEVRRVFEEIRGRIEKPLGIHAHNDSDCAVANSLIAVEAGAVHVQGTINGYGERCGNANLCSIIPSLRMKMGLNCIREDGLMRLTGISRFVSETANLVHREEMPFVGNHAFTHKGGVHVNAIMKNPRAYEHISPETVGNRRRIVISELSGTSTVLQKALERGVDLRRDDPRVKEILDRVEELEKNGYQFDDADGSFEILLRKAMGSYRSFFELEGFRVFVEKKGSERCISEATIRVLINGVEKFTAAEGDGPVNALDNALREALLPFYPSLKEVHLVDFKVRVLDAESGTAAKVRVFTEFSDGNETWGTVGVSENIIEASWQALLDGIEYKLMREEEENER